jgi:DNA-3-methyladenine glycosylase II
MVPVRFETTGPYSLELSLRAAQSFAPKEPTAVEGSFATLRSPIWMDGRATIIEVQQVEEESVAQQRAHEGARHGVDDLLAVLEAASQPPAEPQAIETIARRLVNADQDLRPFYETAAPHPVLGPLTSRLRGLKAFRPATLFEMLVIAVIEQQISLVAAYRIRERLVGRFGTPVGDLTAFPPPASLSHVSPEALQECGLSRRKAEYIGGLAELVSSEKVDMEVWTELPDDEIREQVMAIRGFGRWSADYLLVRGMGRADVAPADDLGIQTLLGRILGAGPRLTPDEVRRVLEPFAPFRGLAVFYILAGSRLSLI